MLNILYLVHRLPYPPNKGDKVRSFNLLKHISKNNNVYLGTFIDDPDDEKYVSVVGKFCKLLYCEKISKKYSSLYSLSGLFVGRALTLSYYISGNFQAWVDDVIKNNNIDAVVVFSSVMAQFVPASYYSRMLVDFVDVDSQKWSEYSDQKYFPFSWLYRREGTRLLEYERYLALNASHSFFVTEKERALFSTLVPESSFKTSALNNGVDSIFFAPGEEFESPFVRDDSSSISLVFTGAMDYWPNIDAVVWFANDVFPLLIKIFPNFRFYIVGRNPSQAVLNLQSSSIIVTGAVKDVRPYLLFSTLVVAPLRIARGVQNKILEAMSMGKPVVASVECVRAIDAVDGVHILSAETPSDFVKKIEFLVQNENLSKMIGDAARVNVEKKYSWNSHLKKIDAYLNFKKIEDPL